jgi:hypothetical protein
MNLIYKIVIPSLMSWTVWFSSQASAQLLDFSYKGPYFPPFSESRRNVQIHFQLDDALIPDSGHFSTVFDGSTTASFANFEMGYGSFEISIDSITQNPNFPTISESLSVVFDLNEQHQMQSWDIEVSSSLSSAGGYGGNSTVRSQVGQSGDLRDSYESRFQSAFFGDNGTEISESFFSDSIAVLGGNLNKFWTITVAPVSQVPLPSSFVLFFSFIGFIWRKWRG